jgi:phage gpG-like protein
MPLPRNLQSISRGGLRMGTAAVGGVEVTMIPSPYILASQFDKLGANIRSFKVPLERSIKQVLAPSFQKNFDVGGRPTAWEALSSITVDKKRSLGSRWPEKPLMRKGRLKRTAGQLNIWTIRGPEGIAYINRLPSHSWYGILHQSGLGSGDAFDAFGFPDRPWAVVQEEDARAIDKVFFDWIEERVAMAGLG